MASLRELDLLDEQGATALRTIPLPLRERLQQPLGTRERGHREDLVSEAARPGYRSRLLLSPRRGIQPIVMHVPLVTGPDVLQEPQQEGNRRKRQGLLLPIAVVSVGQGHPLPIVTESPLGQRRPTGIAAAIGRRLPPVAVAAHHVDDEAGRIPAVETA